METTLVKELGPQTDRFGVPVIERRPRIEVGGRWAPAVVWIPKDAKGPRPLVLIGHGGTHYKTSPMVLDVAIPMVRDYGYVAAAIDGPVHGERRAVFESGKAVQLEYRELWAKGGSVETMTADWMATLDHLCTLPEVDTKRIGWYGISMGTAYGLPFVGADPRIKLAVLGMCGTNRVNSQRLVDDARKTKIPILFQQKSEDDIFTAEGQMEIYDAFPNPAKRLAVYPGPHITPSGVQLTDTIAYLGEGLQKL